MDILDIISSVVPSFTDEQAGQFIKAACLLRDGEDYDVSDLAVEVALKALDAVLVDNYRQKTISTANGRKGGAPKGNQNARKKQQNNQNNLGCSVVLRDDNHLFSDSLGNITDVIDTEQDREFQKTTETKNNPGCLVVSGRVESVAGEKEQEKKETPPIENSNDILFPLEKEKEIEKESTPCILSPKKKSPYDYDLSFIEPDNALLPVFKDWLQYKKERGEPYKPMGLKAAFTKLKTYSHGDPGIAEKIITDAMGNNSQGFFPWRYGNTRQDSDKVDTKNVNSRYDVNSYSYEK